MRDIFLNKKPFILRSGRFWVVRDPAHMISIWAMDEAFHRRYCDLKEGGVHHDEE